MVAARSATALLAGERTDRLLAPADLAAAAGEVDVGGADLPVHLAGGDAVGEQPVGIERDADLARRRRRQRSICETPFTPCSARATVSSTNQDSSSGVMAGARGVGDDRQAFDLDALHDRLVDRARQVGADARDGVLDVVERAVGIHLEPELDDRHRRPSVTVEVMVLDAGDAGDGVLDLLGDLRLELGGRAPDCVDLHLDDGHVDIGKARDRRAC